MSQIANGRNLKKLSIDGPIFFWFQPFVFVGLVFFLVDASHQFKIHFVGILMDPYHEILMMPMIEGCTLFLLYINQPEVPFFTT